MGLTMSILGIDLGTTNSLVGVVDSGFPILFADAEGRRLTPSVVHYGEDGEVLVGARARRAAGAVAGRTAFSVKRRMGERVNLRFGAVEAAPEDVSAEILKHLKSVAERAAGEAFERAVITVPAYFNDAQRQATKRAGELAGLEVVRLLAEPTAAALAYGLDRLGERAKVAVYDLGGGTFDVSVLELNEGVFQVLATDGDTQLGGDDLDRVLAEALYRGAEGDGLESADAGVAGRFLDAARSAKEALSEREEIDVRIPFYAGGRSFEAVLTRAEFERLARPWIERTRGHCVAALAAAGVDSAELDAAVLVGGSSRIPMVRALAAEVFGRESDLSQHPDEAVALGAVIQGGVLSGALREVVLLDVTPLSLGIETFGGLMNVIIPRNTTIPVKRGEMFTNAAAGQGAMRVRVLQGEREMARDNWELGVFEVPFAPGAKGSARVGVQFSLDADGILTVLGRDTATGTDRVLEIVRGAVDVADERVEAMVGESVEHAFDDFNERLWTEAKLKSDELLPAVAQALELAGDAIDGGERAEIERAEAAVREALGGGAAAELKRANAELDRATERLAAVLVERALG